MKKLAALLFLCLTAPPLWADKPLLVEINDFTSGVNTQHIPSKIQGLQNANNFRTDTNSGLQRREGFKNETEGCAFSTAAALHVWQFSDTSNNDWLVRLDTGGVITAASGLGRSNTCLTTNVTGTISVAVDTDADVGLGKFWFTNKTNGLQSWDGTTMVAYPGAPLAARVSVYRNRVILSDVSNEQSSLRLSGELNGGDWSNDSRFSTSPVSIRVGGINDGYKIYDFFPGLGEGIIFKAGNQGGMYRLLGNDQRDFRVEQITPEIGTIYPNTIQQKGFATIFLSNRGIDSYTPPYTFTSIGNPIQNQVDPLARQSSLSNSRKIDTVADWTAGVSSPSLNITTSAIVGSIATSNQLFVDTSSDDWTATYSSMIPLTLLSVSSVPGSLVYSNTRILNPSFEDSSAWAPITGSQGWDFGTVAGITPFHGTQYVYGEIGSIFGGENPGPAWQYKVSEGLAASTMVRVCLVAPVTPSYTNRIACSTTTSGFTFNSWQRYTVDTTNFAGTMGYLRVDVGFAHVGQVADWFTIPFTVAAATQIIVNNTAYYVSTSAFVYVNITHGSTSGGYQEIYTGVDFVGAGPVGLNYATATFVSRPFDTQASSPIFGPFTADVNLGTATFTTQTSTAPNCCWTSSQAVSIPNGIPRNAGQRYVRYVTTFTTPGTLDSYNVRINSVSLQSYATGYFQVGPIDLGSGVSSWGLFTAVDDNGGDGSITYETQSNSVPSFVEANWVPTPLNTLPSIPPNRYVFARMTFKTKAATTTPFVDNLTFNWNVGAGDPKPFAVTYREAYYLFFSTNLNNITTNDVIAVYNRDNAFNTFSGSTLAAATVYNNTLMMADALGTGAVYSLDKSVDGTDAGKNVSSYFTTRRIDGGEPDAEKIFDKVRISISRSDVRVSQIFKVEYSIDGSTQLYRAENVEISTGTKIASLVSNFSLDLLTQGHYIDIKVTELTQNTMPYTIERLALYGTIKEIP